MSQIDLERLRVRQSFFVPIKKEKLAQLIHHELLGNPKLGGKLHVITKPWTMEMHGDLISFHKSYRYSYILLRLSGLPTLKEVEKISKEFGKNRAGKYLETVECIRGNSPDDIFVNIMRSEERGCEIEVECLPVLYRKISLGKIERVEEHQIQDAYINCERFLRTIFVGGLSGTMISKEKLLIQKSEMQFLINDVSIRRITGKINEMLSDATGEVLIFGWMGTILLKKLRELKHKGIEIKLITGLVKGIRRDAMKKGKGHERINIYN